MDSVLLLLVLYFLSTVQSQSGTCVYESLYLKMCSCEVETLTSNKREISVRKNDQQPSCRLKVNANPGQGLRVTAGIVFDVEQTCERECDLSPKFLKITDFRSSYCNCGPAGRRPTNNVVFATNQSSIELSYLNSEFAVFVSAVGCSTEDLIGTDRNAVVTPLRHGPASGVSYSVNVSCPDGFLINNGGSTNLYSWIENTCNVSLLRQNDIWALPKSRCRKVQCARPNEIQNGYIVGDKDQYKFNDDIEYRCLEGYRLQGSAIRYCVARHGLGAIWSGFEPTCAKITCGNLPDITNGAVNGTGNTPGSKLTVLCNAGHTVAGPSQITCRSDGTWSNIPECSPVHCGSPPEVENAVRLIGNQHINRSDSFQSTHYYNCNLGYKLSGRPMVMCLANGSWSHPPRCIEEQCGQVPTFPDQPALYCINCLNATNFRVNSTRTFKCDTGYRPRGQTGPNLITCTSSGLWTAPLPCEKIDCGAKPYVFNGRWISNRSNTSAQLVCERGYILDSNKTIECTDAGVWTSAPKCLPVDCGPITAASDMAPEDAHYPTTYQSTVRFICNAGYTLNSTHVHRTCQADGQWSEPPVCKIKDCGIPVSDTIANGVRLPYYSTLYGDTISFTCNEGHMVADTNVMRCQADGTWSPKPDCIEIDCFIPSNTSAGQLVSYNGTKRGSQAMYICDLYLGSEEMLAVCSENGSWLYPNCEQKQDEIILIIVTGSACAMVLFVIVATVFVGLCFKRKEDDRKQKISSESTNSCNGSDTADIHNDTHTEDKPSIGSFDIRKSREEIMKTEWRKPEGSPPGPYTYSLTRPRSRKPIASESYNLESMSSDEQDGGEVVENQLYAELKLDRQSPANSTTSHGTAEKLNDLNYENDSYVVCIPSNRGYIHERQPNIMEHPRYDGYSTTNPNYFRNFSPKSHASYDTTSSHTLPLRHDSTSSQTIKSTLQPSYM